MPTIQSPWQTLTQSSVRAHSPTVGIPPFERGVRGGRLKRYRSAATRSKH
jgi:hypothetical protein